MKFRKFSWKNADYRIFSDNNNIIIDEIKKQRKILEDYIKLQPDFQTSLKPVKLLNNAPEIARRMHRTSGITGIGPMASVAGCIAQMSADALLSKGFSNAIVENGGDIYVNTDQTIIIGLYAGANSIADKLAFKIEKDYLPVAICSSSSKMGHSLSFGDCDLATVISNDAALADSAATLACNLVKNENDIESVLDKILKIKGITGLLLIKNDKIGLKGDLPELVRNKDNDTKNKITRHSSVSFV